MHIWSKGTASRRTASPRWAGGGREAWWGLGALVLLVVLSGVGAAMGQWKLLGIAWTAFAAMAGAALAGSHRTGERQPQQIVWGYGVASGVMVASASVFLIPEAVAPHAALGGAGIALGVLAGFTFHTLGHQLTHARFVPDHTVTELTAHALADGVVLGLVYTAMPELSLLLGLAIVSHKAPAGYAAAKRRLHRRKDVLVLLLPAAAVGLAALPVGWLKLPPTPVVSALVSGFATGVFLHVAMDFLPHCEIGGEVHEIARQTTHDHWLLDRLRWHAVASTACGVGFVLLAWWALA